MSNELVLVTGGTGFLAAYCILKLLAAGYRVRTTVRSPEREADVKSMLREGGVGTLADGRLNFATADLTKDAGWSEAVAGCAYVLHVASPLPAKEPGDENELIIPAREGGLRVLKAACRAGVKRVVLTSSFAAIGYGHPREKAQFSEEDWTDPSGAVGAYVKSKTLAERAAWDFVAGEGQGMELAVINPVVVLGPALSADFSSSVLLVRRMLQGKLRAVPRLTVGIVDVRDVADLHVTAMTHPAAAGERFLAVAGDFITLRQIAETLRARLGADAARVSTFVLPDWFVRFAAKFNSTARQVAGPELGKVKNASADKARRLLGWKPRSREDAIAAAGESLVRLKLIRRNP